MAIFASNVTFSDAAGMAFSANGDLFVNDFIGSRILRFDGVTGQSLGVFAQGPELEGPRGLAFGPEDGLLYVNNFFQGDVLRYDTQSSEFDGIFADGAQSRRPTALAFAPTVVRGETTGLVPGSTQAFCKNRTTGEKVTLPQLEDEPGWDCEAAGLAVLPGSAIIITIRSVADSEQPVGGALMGLDNSPQIVCANESSGQNTQLTLAAGERNWDCESAGLTVLPNDVVRIVINGRAQ